jgi:PTS system nitrogen regulatory IIA component
MSVPEHSTEQHLQILSELADRFGDADFRDALRGAADITELRGLLYDTVPYDGDARG